MVKQTPKGLQAETRQARAKPKAKESIDILPLKQCQLRKMVTKRFAKQTRQRKIRTTKPSNAGLTQNHFQVLLNELKQENLSCPICLDYCLSPVLTDCGHYYCLPCFEQAHRNSDYCCVCRAHINTFDYEVSPLLKNLFEEHVRTRIDWCEAEIYWTRARELQRRDARRNPSEILRIGQMVDFRWNKIWVEGKISSVHEKTIVVSIYDIEEEEDIKVQVSRHSRALARHRCFTFDPKLSHQQRKIPPIISILVRPQRRRRSPFEQQPVEQPITEQDLQEIMNQRMRRNHWDQDLGDPREQNARAWLFEESQPIFNEAGNIWDHLSLVEEDQAEDNFFQLVL